MGGAKADRLVPSPADAAIVIIIQLRTITAKQSLQRMPWEKKKGERGIRLSESTDREFLHLTMSYQWSSDTFSLGSSLGSEADRLGCKLIVCLYGTCSPK